VSHIIGKLSRKVITLDFISIGGLHTKLGVSKVVGVPILGISRPSLGSSRTK